MEGRACVACGVTYPVEDGILVLEREEGTDLHIARELLDIHALRRRGLYFGRSIESGVERAARVHSAAFVDFHVEMLRPWLAGAVVADLGCGQLPYMDALVGTGIREYYAFDLSRTSLGVARANDRADFPIRFVAAGVGSVPVADQMADVVVSSEVLEHVDDPFAYLEELRRVCRTGGHLSLSTPCASMHLVPSGLLPLVVRPRYARRWWKELNAHAFWKEALAWHPSLRPRVLRRWMRAAGFHVIRHETRLWYYGSYLRPSWRAFEALEQMGWKGAGEAYETYLRLAERLLSLGLPVVRWAGIRQFVLGEKIS